MLCVFYIFYGHLFLVPVLIYVSKLKLSEVQVVMEEESEPLVSGTRSET